jgi:hypothetical protein
MTKTKPISAFWFIREDNKLIQCTKEAFDKAIAEGKSVKYGAYANKKAEHIAEQLEASRMELLAKPDLPTKFRKVLTDPRNVVEVEIISVDDPLFWVKESKLPRYETVNRE